MATVLNRVVRVGVIVKVAFNEDFMEVKEVAINIEEKIFQIESQQMQRPFGGGMSDLSKDEEETGVDGAD